MSLLLPGVDTELIGNYYNLLPGKKKKVLVKEKDLKGSVKNIRVKTLADAD